MVFSQYGLACLKWNFYHFLTTGVKIPDQARLSQKLSITF